MQVIQYATVDAFQVSRPTQKWLHTINHSAQENKILDGYPSPFGDQGKD